MRSAPLKPVIAIACGGTGGHLFPGLAVGKELQRRQCDVHLLISPKDVDQQAVKAATGMAVAVLPAVGLGRRQLVRFAGGFLKSFLASRKLFRRCRPLGVLAMGGFTSAPPVLAGKACGALTFLHESNTIPGKANRFLARFVDQAFVGFEQTAARLGHEFASQTGTPVRAEFSPADPLAGRGVFGLEPQQPVLLVTGGSQGASPLNELVLAALPEIRQRLPQLQFLHLSGANDEARVAAAYRHSPARAVVHAFLGEMHLALGAATLAISRAGASSLAELAAVRLPAILIPYPLAADNHQLHNARAYADTGAAVLLEQASATPSLLAGQVIRLIQDDARRGAMQQALARWHKPQAAATIADKITALLAARRRWPACQVGCGAAERTDISAVESVLA